MSRSLLRFAPLLLAAGAFAQQPVDTTHLAANALATAQEAATGAKTAVATANAAAGEARAASSEAKAAQEANEATDNRVKVLERLREIDAEDAAAKAKTTPVVQANGSGLLFRSADTTYSIRLRGVLRAAGTWDLNDENNQTVDQFQNQTVRLGFEGALARKIEYKIQADFSKGAVGLQDAYTDLKLAKWAVVRVGKFQVPLGWERFQAPGDLSFYDRALPSSIAPNRDVGVQVGGDLFEGRLQYAIAGVNGGADGSNINGDGNDDKDGYARLWALPAKGSGLVWLEGLGLGVAGSYGYHDNLPTNYRTAGGQTFFTWNAIDSVKGEGWRIAPQASWTAGPYWIWGELIRSVEQVRTSAIGATTTDSVGKGSANKGLVYRYTSKAAVEPGTPTEIGVQAWQAGISWVVTGEDASEKGVKPRHPFDGSENSGWGALELSTRLSGLTVDDEAFPVYADTAKSAKSALAWAVAANWHLVKGTRIQVAFEQTLFDGGAIRFDHVDTDAKGKKTNVNVVRDRKPEDQLSVVASTSF